MPFMNVDENVYCENHLNPKKEMCVSHFMAKFSGLFFEPGHKKPYKMTYGQCALTQNLRLRTHVESSLGDV